MRLQRCCRTLAKLYHYAIFFCPGRQGRVCSISAHPSPLSRCLWISGTRWGDGPRIVSPQAHAEGPRSPFRVRLLTTVLPFSVFHQRGISHTSSSAEVGH